MLNLPPLSLSGCYVDTILLGSLSVVLGETTSRWSNSSLKHFPQTLSHAFVRWGYCSLCRHTWQPARLPRDMTWLSAVDVEVRAARHGGALVKPPHTKLLTTTFDDVLPLSQIICCFWFPCRNFNSICRKCVQYLYLQINLLKLDSNIFPITPIMYHKY
jgi:hypothetical protein